MNRPAHIISLCIAALPLLLAQSCQSDDHTVSTGSRTVEIEAAISGNATRIAYNGKTSQFDEGDKIRVTAVPAGTNIDENSLSSTYEYTPYTNLHQPTPPTQTYTWQSPAPILWPLEETAYDFYGIYPAIDNNYDYQIKGDAAHDDVMLAKTASKSYKDGKISLAFSHKMAKLAVSLRLRDEIPADAGIKVSVEAIASFTIDLASQKVTTAGEDKKEITFIEQTPKSEYYALLPGQDGIKTITIKVTPAAPGQPSRQYTWTIPQGSLPLKAGEITTVNLNVGNDGITIGSVTVTPWTEKEIDNQGQQAETE